MRCHQIIRVICFRLRLTNRIFRLLQIIMMNMKEKIEGVSLKRAVVCCLQVRLPPI